MTWSIIGAHYCYLDNPSARRLGCNHAIIQICVAYSKIVNINESSFTVEKENKMDRMSLFRNIKANMRLD